MKKKAIAKKMAKFEPKLRVDWTKNKSYQNARERNKNK